MNADCGAEASDEARNNYADKQLALMDRRLMDRRAEYLECDQRNVNLLNGISV